MWYVYVVDTHVDMLEQQQDLTQSLQAIHRLKNHAAFHAIQDEERVIKDLSPDPNLSDIQAASVLLTIKM